MKKDIILYVVLGTLLMLLLGVVYSYSMFRIELENMYQLSKTESGIPYMMALFFFSTFMAVGGMLYSKFNTTLIALIGVLSITLGFMLSGLSNSVFQISITYGMLVGIGVGFLYGLPLRIVAQLDYPKVGLLTGIVLLGFGLSSTIFAPLINLFITNFGIQSTFIYLGIIYFIVLLPLSYLLSKRDHQDKTTSKKMNFAVIKEAKFRSLYIVFFIGTFIGLTFIGFTGSIAKELIGINEGTIALLLGVFSVFNGVGRPLFGYLNDQLGFKVSATISYISLIAFTLLCYFLYTNYIVFVISFIVFYLNFGGWLSLAPTTTIDLYGKEEYSRVFGLVYTAYGFGAIFGNMISGALVDFVGLRSIFLLMTIISVIGFVLIQTLFKHYKKA